MPAQKKLPCANSQAAQILITRPIKVRTFGWIFDNASQRTMRLMIAPKNLPIPPVSVISFRLVNRGQLQDFQLLHAARTLHFYLVPDFFVEKRTADRRS